MFTLMPKLSSQLTETKFRQIVREEIGQKFDDFEHKVDQKFDDFEHKVDQKFDDFERKVDQKFDDFEERMDRKFDDLKDYMYNLVDRNITEIQDMRTEHTTNTQAIPDMKEQLINHEDRIEKLEVSMATL